MRFLVSFCMAVAVLAAANVSAADPADGDYRLAYALYQVAEEPVDRGDFVFHHGRVYRFRQDSPELVILDRSAKKVEFLDISRREQTSISSSQVDLAMKALRAALTQTIAEMETEGGRANRLAAASTRELLDPPFEVTFDEAKHTLNLKSPRVQVTALGEPDPDAARLDATAVALMTLVKVDAMRAPDKRNPPFIPLTALGDLTEKRRLRPSELTFLYRLGGPPQKYRWTYHLIARLTEREREALARVEYLRLHAKRLSVEDYEQVGPR